MGQRQFGQGPFRPACEIDKDLAPVRRILLSLRQAIADQPVDQLDRGVVPDTKALGQNANGDGPSRGAFDGEQCLMLLGAEPRFRRGAYTEHQEGAQVIAELRQPLIIQLVERSAPSHLYPLKLQVLKRNRARLSWNDKSSDCAAQPAKAPQSRKPASRLYLKTIYYGQ